MPAPEHAVFAALLICLSAALGTLWLARRKTLAGWVMFLAVASSSALVLAGAAKVILSGPDQAVTYLTVPAIGFALRIHVDGLSAVFLGLVATVAVPAAFYSIDYLNHQEEPGAGRYHPNFLVFVAALYGLVSTTDMMWFFFIFWQMMTWAGWALIRYERWKPENVQAAGKYLRMMQLACGLTMLGAAMLARTGATSADGEVLMKHDFDAVMLHLPAQLEGEGAWVAMAFALFLAGFGIKLGMWPFGRVWLPDAHPAAPSPVSAMLSGVMIKTGVYGLMRYFLWLVPAEALGDYPIGQWGILIAALGTITLFTGTAEALRQEQSKRLLAFSSIGQGGYILLGLGVCMTLLGSPGPATGALAAAAFCGALLHTLNHGVFKSLLFLNAGSVLRATGTQDLNALGGLMRPMPVTALTALIASCSIAGVPLFSGFASKWSICVAAIQGTPECGLLALFAAVAILTSALTLALFIKFFGVTFLSRTSALVAGRKAKLPTLEAGAKMRAAQVALATVCLAFGLVPAMGTVLIGHALAASRQGLGAILADATPARLGEWGALGSFDGRSLYAPLVVALVLVLLFVAVRRLARLGGAPRRAAAPWLCGYAVETEANRYRASGFYGEVKQLLARVESRARPKGEPVRAPNQSTIEGSYAWSSKRN